MNIWDPDKFVKAWNFAALTHKAQTVPGTELPYINHVGNVAMEVMTAAALSNNIDHPNLLIQCALLHDVIEDTEYSYQDILNQFGASVASGVQALSKDDSIPTKKEVSV